MIGSEKGPCPKTISVSEIVTEMANLLRQADMTQFWETHFFPRLVDQCLFAAARDYHEEREGRQLIQEIERLKTSNI